MLYKDHSKCARTASEQQIPEHTEHEKNSPLLALLPVHPPIRNKTDIQFFEPFAHGDVIDQDHSKTANPSE